jgi:hypothetical protein
MCRKLDSKQLQVLYKKLDTKVMCKKLDTNVICKKLNTKVMCISYSIEFMYISYSTRLKLRNTLSVHKRIQLWKRASQTYSPLTKFIVNSISIYVSK